MSSPLHILKRRPIVGQATTETPHVTTITSKFLRLETMHVWPRTGPGTIGEASRGRGCTTFVSETCPHLRIRALKSLPTLTYSKFVPKRSSSCEGVKTHFKEKNEMEGGKKTAIIPDEKPQVA